MTIIRLEKHYENRLKKQAKYHPKLSRNKQSKLSGTRNKNQPRE